MMKKSIKTDLDIIRKNVTIEESGGDFYKPYLGKEEGFQKAVAQYLDSLGVLWFHPPNEIKAKPQYMAKRKLLGVKSGVPDVCILEPRGDYHGLFIELKAGVNKATDNQKVWLDRLYNNGYVTEVCYSLDKAIFLIDNYLRRGK